MGRVKREMKLIQLEKSRLLTFQKRRKGLEKKISELVTLCGINACMICFGPEGSRFSGPFLWPDAQSTEIIFKKYFGINKAEREKRMLRLPDFVSSKDIASSSSNNNNKEEGIRGSESVSCDGSSSGASGCGDCDSRAMSSSDASGGGDGGWRAMRELVQMIEANSSEKVLQEVQRRLDLALVMVKNRIKLLKVQSLDLNQPLSVPPKEEDVMGDGTMREGFIRENEGRKENDAAAQESSNQQEIPMEVEEENSTTINSNAAATTSAIRIHSKGSGLRFRKSSGSALLPPVLPSIMALLPMDREPSSE